MRYAIVKNNAVENTIEVNPYTARKDFPNAIQSDIAGIGDEYRDGRFYRDGELVKTQEELYAGALQESTDMKEALEILGIEPEDEHEDV